MKEIIELTIDLTAIDTDGLLEDWRWIVPRQFRPIQLTKFGDWFFTSPDGSVYMLDLLEAELSKVAESIAEFNELKDHAENHSDWYLDGFVFLCHAEGLALSPGECYGWKIHPMIGGAFNFENIQVFDLRVYQTLMGQLLRQWKTLKPGQPIPPIQIIK